MKFLITIYFLLVVSVTVKAQEDSTVTDSIYLYKRAQQNYKSLQWGVSQLTSSNINKVANVELAHNFQNGQFRQSQQAERTSAITLKTEGISTLDRFKLYGYFSFSRTWQDSLAFSQKGIEDPHQPYYHIVGKPGVFERQTYLGGGIIAYNLIKNKLFLGTGLDYLYNSSARSVDPRSLVTTFRLKFNPQLTYKSNNHTFGIGIEAGYGDETTKINYKNDDYQGSLLFPDRISYLNYGYGYLEINQIGFNRKTQYTGFNLNYIGKMAKWDLTGKLSYLIAKEDNLYPKINAIVDEKFGTYQVETYKVDLLLNQKNKQISFNIKQENGDDNLIKLAARNYTFSATEVNFGYSYSKHKVEWFGEVNYKEVAQRDAAAAHSVKYDYLHPKLGGILHWKNFKKDLFSTELALGARLPIKNEINIPVTQVNLFTQGVAYPDYLYWASKAGEVHVKFNYVTGKIINKFKTGFSLKTTYLHSLQTPVHNFATKFTPDKYYIDLNLALNLYF